MITKGMTMGVGLMVKGMSLHWIDRILSLVSKVGTLFKISGELR